MLFLPPVPLLPFVAQLIEPLPGAPTWELGLLGSVMVVVLGYVGKYLIGQVDKARAEAETARTKCAETCDKRLADEERACDERIAKLETKLDESAALLRRQMESQQRQIEAQQQLIETLHAVGRTAKGGA